MPIETICQGCGRKLRVPDKHAGKQARCPECRQVYTVPEAVEPRVAAQDTQPWRPRHDALMWRLRIVDGRVYGPVDKRELDEWLAEGRISSDCQVQSNASSEWLPASQLYPELLTAAKATAPQTRFTPPHESYVPGNQPPENPYESYSEFPTRRRYLRQHRGGQILTLGLLGFCCVLFGIFAWSMGHSDLREIREGRMDPAGRGTTQAGYILGIITTLLQAGRILMGIFEHAF